MDDKIKIKVVFVGDGGVGKSSITQKLFMGSTYNQQNDENLYKPTIGSDFFTKIYQIAPDKAL